MRQWEEYNMQIYKLPQSMNVFHLRNFTDNAGRLGGLDQMIFSKNHSDCRKAINNGRPPLI